MQNIEIRRPQPGKRSMESLIEDSAIDSPFDYEAHQLRKAFNETILSMNIKQGEKERQIEKLRIQLREKQQDDNKHQTSLKRLQEELNHKSSQYTELNDLYKDTKKRLQYVQYKLICLQESRETVQEAEWEAERETLGKKRLQNQIYKEFETIISKKVEYFTSDIKKMTLSLQAEQRIETFLEELLLINPYSERKLVQQIKQQQRDSLYGTIRKDHQQPFQNLDDRQLLDKSLEKLRILNRQHQGHPTGQKMSEEQGGCLRDRSVSPSKRRRLFI